MKPILPYACTNLIVKYYITIASYICMYVYPIAFNLTQLAT